MKGKYTSGFDGKIYATSSAHKRLMEEIRQTNIFNFKCKPLKCVYIPTVKDQVLQMLVKLALKRKIILK